LEVWLTKACPSTPEGKGPKGEAAIIDNLIGAGIGYLVDQLGSALSAAAKADKDGLAVSGQAPSYLYFMDTPKGANSRMPFVQRCAVLAISESPPIKWCSTTPFSGTRPCESVDLGAGEKTTRLAELLKTPTGHIESLNGSGAPAFYAEIELIDSNDKKALIPRLRALFYPAGVNRSSKFADPKRPRSVGLSISGTTAAGQPALGSIHIVLKDITPQATLQIRPGNLEDDSPQKGLDALPSPLWVSYSPPPDNLVVAASAFGAAPVNLAVEVREIGDLSVFLQALASAFSANKASIESSLKSKLEPSAVSQAATTKEASALGATSRFHSLMAVVYKDEAALLAACEKPHSGGPAENTGRAGVFQAIYQLSADQDAAKMLYVQNKDVGAPSFTYNLDTVSALSGETAYKVCVKIGARANGS